MKISLIAALAANRVIGRDGGLPWHLPPDLRRFKQLTMGHTMILGRKTWESIGRALPGRFMLVVTRQEDFPVPPGEDRVRVVPSVEEALRAARERDPEGVVFVAGGAEVYRQTLPIADRLELTRIERELEGDTFFPDFEESDWRLVWEERHEAGESSLFAYCFQTWERVRPEAAP